MSPLKCPYGLGKYSPWLADEENFSLQIVLKGQNNALIRKEKKCLRSSQ